MTSGTHLHIGAVASSASFSDTFCSFPQKRKLTISIDLGDKHSETWIKNSSALEFCLGYIPFFVSSIFRCHSDTGLRWTGDSLLNEMQR